MIEQRLKKLRTEQGITQEGLANTIGISKNFITMVERGKRKPSYEVLERLADFFDTSTDYLLGRTDIVKPPEDIPAEYMEVLKEWEAEGRTPEEIRKLWQDIKTIIKKYK